MIDILIPLGNGSRFNDLELRYCLRSIEKHLRGVHCIMIVGEKPEWIKWSDKRFTGAIHIPFKDNPNNWMRAHNIYSKIMVGIQYFDDLKFDYQSQGQFEKNEITASWVQLTDNFLFMNDDHFLLQDFEASEFPYYHRGPIDLNSFEGNQPQMIQMNNTLKEWGGNLLDFDIHCPIVYDKKRFALTFKGREWPEHGYGIKSAYCNVWYPTSVCIEDLKFHEPAMKESIYRVLEGRPWFSIGDKVLKSGDMQNVLQELFPHKSKYEL